MYFFTKCVSGKITKIQPCVNCNWVELECFVVGCSGPDLIQSIFDLYTILLTHTSLSPDRSYYGMTVIIMRIEADRLLALRHLFRCRTNGRLTTTNSGDDKYVESKGEREGEGASQASKESNCNQSDIAIGGSHNENTGERGSERRCHCHCPIDDANQSSSNHSQRTEPKCVCVCI